MKTRNQLLAAALLALQPVASFGQATVAGFPGMTIDQVQAAGRAAMQKLHADLRAQDWTSAAADCKTAMTYKAALTPDEDIQLGRDETIIVFKALSGADGTAVNIPAAGAAAPVGVPAGAAAAAAAPAAAPAAGQVDPSRISDAGSVHYVITKVVQQSAKYEISGTVTSSQDTNIHFYTGWVGATSPSGDPNLPCDSVSLGDNPDLNSPSIAVVAGKSYTFSVSIVTRSATTASLQELRIRQRTPNGDQTAVFENLQPDAPGTVYPDAGTPAGAAAATAAPGAPAVPGTAVPAPAPATVVPVAAAGATPSVPAAPAAQAPAVPAPAGATPVAPAGTTAAPLSPADTAAQTLITKMQTDAAANQWPAVGADVKQIHAVDSNGVQKSQVSAAMKLKIADAIKATDAIHKLSKMPAPTTPAQQLVKAQLEMDAHLLDAAQADITAVSANKKLDKQDAEQLQRDKVRIARLQTLQAQGQ